MIDTIKGPMAEDQLEKRSGKFENDNERTTWVEYWHEGELVHRSAHVDLKHGVASLLMQGAFT
jgi:hypothetical protein